MATFLDRTLRVAASFEGLIACLALANENVWAAPDPIKDDTTPRAAAMEISCIFLAGCLSRLLSFY